MASPDVAAILAKAFVPLRLEADRMIGGKEILKRYQAGEGGIPWFVFLDGEGKAVVTSDGPKGNVGFPAAPHEIAYFRTMLDRSRTALTDADINALVASLEAANKK
jgi:hypothetical protein